LSGARIISQVCTKGKEENKEGVRSSLIKNTEGEGKKKRKGKLLAGMVALRLKDFTTGEGRKRALSGHGEENNRGGGRNNIDKCNKRYGYDQVTCRGERKGWWRKAGRRGGERRKKSREKK